MGLSERQASREVLNQMLAELQRLNATETEMMARLHGGEILNNVLEVATYTFPAGGAWSKDYPAAIGSILVTNGTAQPITYAAGGAFGGAPTVGSGVQIIPANSWLAIPVGGTTFTLYGTAGGTFGLQAFTSMIAFGGSR